MCVCVDRASHIERVKGKSLSLVSYISGSQPATQTALRYILLDKQSVAATPGVCHDYRRHRIVKMSRQEINDPPYLPSKAPNNAKCPPGWWRTIKDFPDGKIDPT